jgi:hypothetical protein
MARKAGITTAQAAEFLFACLIESEAEGYQQMNESSPDVPTPDEVSRDGTRLYLQFGEQLFIVRVSQYRRRARPGRGVSHGKQG